MLPICAKTEQEIIAIVKSVSDVSDPHNLRTRRLGNRIAIEMHVRMPGTTTLADAHQHATLIEQRLRERFGASTHITIHMEPEK